MAPTPVLDRVEDTVRRRSTDLVELSHAIHAEPELAFAEHRSCAKTQALVAERGFEITAAAGGLDTAFRADFGSGPLTVGVCAEYDALPEIGHACGHNIIAASAVGAALALADVADELGLTVVAAGHARRRVRRRKSVAAQRRSVRRPGGRGDGASRSGRYRGGPVADPVRGSGDLPRKRSPCVGRAVPGRQRRRRSHRRAGGDRAAASAAGARAAGARHRHRGRAGRQRHPRAHRAAVHDARHRGVVAGRPGSQSGRLLPGRRGGHRLRLQRRADRADVRRAQTRPLAGRDRPRRDDAARALALRQGTRGGAPAGQHRHGQRHPAAARHPSDGRRRSRRCVVAPARFHRGRRRSHGRQGRHRRRNHVGAHGRSSCRVAPRTRPGAGAHMLGGRRS